MEHARGTEVGNFLFCRRLRVIFLQIRVEMIICVIQRKTTRSIVSAHLWASETTIGIVVTHVPIRGTRCPRYCYAITVMILKSIWYIVLHCWLSIRDTMFMLSSWVMVDAAVVIANYLKLVLHTLVLITTGTWKIKTSCQLICITMSNF